MENYKKTFVKIFIGQTISLLTSAIVQYAIIWYITFKTGSATNLAIATIAGILPQLLLGPFAGVVVDRVDRKKLMMLSDILIAVATLILAILFMIGEHSLVGMYIILAVRALGGTFHAPSFQASIPLIAPQDKLVKLSGINQTLQSITLIVAPIIAGTLFGVVDISYLILLDIIGALFGVGSIAMVKIPKPEIKQKQNNFKKEMLEGIKEIKENKFLLALTIFVVIISILFMPISSMYPLITSTYFGLEAIHISIVEVAFSIGMLMGGVIMSSWKGFKKKQYTIIFTMLFFAIALILSGLVPNNKFWLFVILTGTMGIMAPFFNGIYTVILQLKVAPEKLGRVFSISLSLMTVATPIGLLVTAPIAERIGVEKVFVLLGMLMLLTCVIATQIKVIKREN